MTIFSAVMPINDRPPCNQLYPRCSAKGPRRRPWEISHLLGTFSSDRGRPHMKRASGRGTGRPGAFALAPGGDFRRCADGHGHSSGELEWPLQTDVGTSWTSFYLLPVAGIWQWPLSPRGALSILSQCQRAPTFTFSDWRKIGVRHLQRNGMLAPPSHHGKAADQSQSRCRTTEGPSQNPTSWSGRARQLRGKSRFTA
jgi:hypothetical protein